MPNYHISALIRVKEGCLEQVKAAILANIPNVRAEQGCMVYDLHQAMDGSNCLYFYEIWQDKVAFEAHVKAPHMLTYREVVKDWVDGPTEVRLWSGVDIARPGFNTKA